VTSARPSDASASRRESVAPAGGPSATATAGLTFVGTATTILELGCFTLLADPNFLHRGQRACLGRGSGRGA